MSELTPEESNGHVKPAPAATLAAEAPITVPRQNTTGSGLGLPHAEPRPYTADEDPTYESFAYESHMEPPEVPNGELSLPTRRTGSPVPPGGPPGGDGPATPPAPGSEPPRDRELDLFDHLRELRVRLLRCVGYICAAAVFTWMNGQLISNWLVWPIDHALRLYANGGGKIITTEPTEGFMTYFQISLIAAILLTFPAWIYEMWAFIEPALTHKERRYTTVLIPFSVGLFVIGALFGYILSPLFFRFFLTYQPLNSQAYYSYNKSVVLLGKMLLCFGICFQVPVITIFVNKIGLVSRNWMVEYWRHTVIIIFTLVTFIAPTWDPVTLIFCATPPCLLYLLSLWIIKWL